MPNENVLPVELVYPVRTGKESLIAWVGSLIGLLLNVWFSMLVLGILHSNLPAVPALGWDAMLAIMVLISLAGKVFMNPPSLFFRQAK